MSVYIGKRVLVLSIQFIHRVLLRALKSTTRVFKNRYCEVGTLFPQFLFTGEAYAYDVGI